MTAAQPPFRRLPESVRSDLRFLAYFIGSCSILGEDADDDLFDRYIKELSVSGPFLGELFWASDIDAAPHRIRGVR